MASTRIRDIEVPADYHLRERASPHSGLADRSQLLMRLGLGNQVELACACFSATIAATQ
jgi:hypothetical protein